jgi:4-hydroxybenzoate polyprenyltransferase
LAVFTISMILVGINKGYEINSNGVIYYIGVLMSSIILLFQILTVNLDNPKDCMKKFTQNKWIGVIVLLSIILSNFKKE